MANDFAIIASGGKQYKVTAGQKIRVEKLGAEKGETFSFDKVLLRSEGGKVEIGSPYLPSAKVEATVVRAVRGEKKIIFKHHSKTRQRRRKGHRQDYSEVAVSKI